jgi:hypothetical protein
VIEMHYCTTSDGARIDCICVRGQDHDESLFDVPVGEEEQDQ